MLAVDTSSRIAKLASLLALLCLVPVAGQAQESTNSPAAQTAANTPAGASDEAFAKLRAQCEAVPCSKDSGDVCVAAAEMLLVEEVPNAYHDMDKAQRVKVALRLLELGVHNSNLARAKAYDLYAEQGFFAYISNSNRDPHRGNELLDMMVKSGYPGGLVRKLQQSLSFFGDDKGKLCNEALAMRSRKDIDADSMKILNGVNDSIYCSPDKSKN